MSFPLRPEGWITPGRGVEPAAPVFAQEADDMEETLLGRESRPCWFYRGRANTEPDETRVQPCWRSLRVTRFTCKRDLAGDVFPW